LDLEAAASLIRTYEVQFVPGLLQTEEYARAVIRICYGDSGGVTGPDGGADDANSEVERRVELRMGRQKLLRRADPPRLWAVLDEAVIRRPIGGQAVLRAQLRCLLEVCELPAVRLQIVPFRAGGHAAAGGAFTILRLPAEELPDVVYVEYLTSAVSIERREEVDRYAASVSRLFIEATPPSRTPDLLREALRDV
jgi:hypothetical protein